MTLPKNWLWFRPDIYSAAQIIVEHREHFLDAFGRIVDTEDKKEKSYYIIVRSLKASVDLHLSAMLDVTA